jgi:hypothetical protein
MIHRFLFLLIVFVPVTFTIVKAGDTVFTTPPDTRFWNPEYMQEVFLDEFNGDRLNTDVWAIDLCKSRGYSGNNEGEPKNIEVSNGTLKLTVHYEPANVDTNCWENTNFVSDYTTAEITTQWDRFKYGSFETKCFMPRGEHYCYAYWLWGPGGNGFPDNGFASEIDIAEGTEWSDGTNHEMKTSVHYWSHTDGEIKLPKDWSFGYGTKYEGDWHVYKLIWNPYEIILYIDESEIWRRSKYYTDADTTTNDVGIDQIIAGSLYQVRDYFPEHEMQNTFQMHIQNGVLPDEIPVSMEVDYVKVSQFFLAPEIDCADVIDSVGTAKLDVDSMANNISWHLSPDSLFQKTQGSGTLAEIIAAPGMQGQAILTYAFNMPSGETFSATHNFKVDGVSAVQPKFCVEKNLRLSIYPNPGSEETTISMEEDLNSHTKWNLEIYTLSGQLKLEQNNLISKDFKINLSGWQKGVYMVRINNYNQVISGKLVVN